MYGGKIRIHDGLCRCVCRYACMYMGSNVLKQLCDKEGGKLSTTGANAVWTENSAG